MLNKKKLQNDIFLSSLLNYKIYNEKFKVGKFNNIYIIDSFLYLFLKVNLE